MLSSFFLRTVLLISLPVVATSPVVVAQLSYEDLRAGYLENVRNANLGYYMVEWRCFRGVEREFIDAIGQHNSKLNLLIQDLDQANTDGIEQYITGMNYWTKPVPYENENFLCRLYFSPKGIRREVCRNLQGSPLTTPFFPLIDLDAFGAAADGTGLFPHVTVIPNDGEIYWGGGQTGTGETGFGISLKSAFAESAIQSPLSFGGTGVAKLFRFCGDEIFPSEPNDSIMLGDQRVSREGKIAILEIEGACRDLVYSGYDIRTGTRFRAEIEIDKGFLPRLIQKAPLIEVDGKRISNRADHQWEEEIRFENRQTNLGFFLPWRIKTTQKWLLHSPERYLDDHQRLSVSEQLAKAYGFPMEPGDQSIPWNRTELVVNAFQPQNGKAFNEVFNLKVPQKLDRFSDARTGTVLVNSRSAERRLALAVDQLKIEPQQRNLNRFMLFWGALSITFIALLYFIVKRKA